MGDIILGNLNATIPNMEGSGKSPYIKELCRFSSNNEDYQTQISFIKNTIASAQFLDNETLRMFEAVCHAIIVRVTNRFADYYWYNISSNLKIQLGKDLAFTILKERLDNLKPITKL